MNTDNFEDEVFWRLKKSGSLNNYFRLFGIFLTLYLVFATYYTSKLIETKDTILFSTFFLILSPAFISLIGTLYFYLQKKKYNGALSNSTYGENNRSYSEMKNIRSFIYKDLKSYLDEELIELKDKVGSKDIDEAVFSEDQKSEIINKIVKYIEDKSTDEFIESIEEKITERFEDNEIDKRTRDTVNRLKDEVSSLGGRGSLNLSLGIATTLAGLALLSFVVFTNDFNSEDPFKFIYSFVPRITLVVFIELFAYFFLNLYKQSLSEIKYFQNELTNIESKFISLKMARNINDQKTIDNILDNLVKTERNHILKKGESTVELEVTKNKDKSILDVINALTGTLKPSKSS